MNIEVKDGLITITGLDAETAGALARALIIAVPHLDPGDAQLIDSYKENFKLAALAAVQQQNMSMTVCDSVTQFVNVLIGERQ